MINLIVGGVTVALDRDEVIKHEGKHYTTMDGIAGLFGVNKSVFDRFLRVHPNLIFDEIHREKIYYGTLAISMFGIYLPAQNKIALKFKRRLVTLQAEDNKKDMHYLKANSSEYLKQFKKHRWEK